jgi:thiamine biosynthesis lipoprotein
MMRSCASDIRRVRPLLGTFVEIRIAALPNDADAVAAISAAFRAVERVQRLMSAHDPDSELSRLSRRRNFRDPMPVHRWTYTVLAAAKEISERSADIFDCAVAPLLAVHGFLPRRLAAAGAGSSCRDIELLDDGQIRIRQPIALDFGGIAKGFAVDRAVDALRSAGITSGAVNAGGDLRLFGPHSELVHVRDPAHPDRLVAIGTLTDGAAATSANYGEGRTSRQPSPIVDMRTRTALPARCRSVSVIAPDAMTADALTKVVAVAGSVASADLLAEYCAYSVVLDG